MCCNYLARLEEQGVGAQWSNFFSSPVSGDGFSLGYGISMMMVDAIIYGILTWYIEAVLPGINCAFYSSLTKGLSTRWSTVLQLCVCCVGLNIHHLHFNSRIRKAVGQNFSRSLNRLLVLSPRYEMVSCLTHEDGVGGRSGVGVGS